MKAQTNQTPKTQTEDSQAQKRFIEDGKGLEIYDSEEAYRAAKKKDIDTIKEL